ncbi:hypothetical protein [Algoriphagus sp. Y33]|uniref:hypothetical protein n=1 Tax=Algoriphagus sp. Y33 TaxID=2772483 RepID=UPI00177AA2BF|nr:hypothetical protein [Algoriphagus sp. Y33]
MEDLMYYNEISNIIEKVERGQDPYSSSNGFAILLNSVGTNIHKELSNSCFIKTDYACKLVLENYHKMNVINSSSAINDENKWKITSEFTYMSFAKILDAIDFTHHEYISKTKTYSYKSINSFSLKSEYTKILSRIIEIILILKKFYNLVDINNQLYKESQKIFELAQSLDIKINSREENLEYYLSVNIDELSKIDTTDSVKYYKCFDYSVIFSSYTDYSFQEAKQSLDNVKSWKPFRSKLKKMHEIDAATQNLNNELKKLKYKRDNLKRQIENEIVLMKEEIDRLISFSNVQNIDYPSNSMDNSNILEVKKIATAKIRKALDKKVKEIDGPFDLFNIQMAQNELVLMINNYKETFKRNQHRLKLSEIEIENLFNGLFNDLHEEYFN